MAGNTNRFSEDRAESELKKRQERFSRKDFKEVIDNEDKLESKFRSKPKLAQFFDDFKLLFSLISDYYHGRYREVPWYVITAIGAAMLYVLSPMDLIMDFIPGAGYIDDAAVFFFCIKQIKDELEKYKLWKTTYQ